MAYVKGQAFLYQQVTENGDPSEGATITAYLSGTSTLTPLYSDDIGTEAGTTITLNSYGRPTNGAGTAIDIWFDTSVGPYKLVYKTAAGAELLTVDPYHPSSSITFVDAVDSGASDSLHDYVGAYDGQQITTGGYYTVGDGGGGNWYWDASSSAVAAQGSVLVPTGHVGVGRWIAIFDGVYPVARFGTKGDGTTDDATAITAAITYVSGQGGGTVLLNDHTTYAVTDLTLLVGVHLSGREQKRAGLVLPFATVNDYPGPVIKFLVGTGVNGIFVDADAPNAGIHNLAIDGEAATATTALVRLSDDAVSGGASTRPGTQISHVLFYKGGGATASQLVIESNHKEAHVDTCYFRGGDGRATAVTGYGLYTVGQDLRCTNCLGSFFVENVVFENGTSSHYLNTEWWGSQKYGMDIASNSQNIYMNHCAFSDHGQGGLRITEADRVNIVQGMFWENALDSAAPDVYVSGVHEGIVFTSPVFRGSAGSVTFCIQDAGNGVTDGAGMGTITNMLIRPTSGSYDEALSPLAQAHWLYSNMSRGFYPDREGRQVLVNDDPHFSNFVDGVPSGWEKRGTETVAIDTVNVPLGYDQGIKITSDTVAASAIQMVLPVHEFAGKRIRVSGVFLPAGTTFTGNQYIAVVDNGTNGNTIHDLYADATLRWYSMEHTCSTDATTLQVRLCADDAGGNNYDLYAYGVRIECDGLYRRPRTATATAAQIAQDTNAINTIDKYQGKIVFDTTNNRLMVATGTGATDDWYIADGSASVTPV